MLFYNDVRNYMKIKGRSGVIIWITTLSLSFSTVVFVTKYNDFDNFINYLLIFIFMVACTIVIASFIFRNYLIVTKQTITICFGITTTVLSIESIKSLKKVKNFIASSSASINRIEIEYIDGIIYVSPKDEDNFINVVCSYNPKTKYID